MKTDRLHHVADRPAALDWPAVTAGATAIFLTRDALPLPAEAVMRPLREIWTYRIDADNLRTLLAAARPRLLSIHGTHVADLAFLSEHRQFEGLAMDWNNKVRTLDWLAPLAGLTVLSLQDMRHVRDFSPLAGLVNLTSLSLSGGIDTKLTLDTLAPLAGLPRVEELMLANVKIVDGSLQALAAMPALRRLLIGNNAASFEEFARLSVRAPQVACDQFRGYVQLDGTPPPGVDPLAAIDLIGDARVLVAGKHGPFLRARTDRDRLIRYCEKFQALQRAT